MIFRDARYSEIMKADRTCRYAAMDLAAYVLKFWPWL